MFSENTLQVKNSLYIEIDKYISLGDSYKEKEGDEKGVTQFIDDILNERIKMKISTKPIPKNSCKINEKESGKIFKVNYLHLFERYSYICTKNQNSYTISALWILI